MLAYIVALCFGIFAMIMLSLTVGKEINYPVKPKVLIFLVGFTTAIIGLKVIGWLENGFWGPFSFYGAHFFAPLGCLLACFLLEVPKAERGDIVDISAPSLCIGLAAHKIACFIQGCCAGFVMRITENGDKVRFPAQLVESGVALLTMFFFCYLIKKKTQRGKIFFWYMIVYGVERFLLTFLRDPGHTILGLQDGQFWSVVSILVGAFLLYYQHLQAVNAEDKKAVIKTRRAHKAR